MESIEDKLNESQLEIAAIHNFLESLPEEVLTPKNARSWRRLSLVEEVREAAKELNQLESCAKQLHKIASIASLMYVRHCLKSERESCSRAYDKAAAFNSISFLILGLLVIISTSFNQTLLATIGIIYLLTFVALIIRVIVTSRKYLQEFNLLNKLEALLEMAEEDCCSEKIQ